MPKGRTQKYYDKNPEANKKRLAYQKEYNKKPEERKRRSELVKANRKAGTHGNGDKLDMSHTRSGKVVKEAQSKNRARNGHGNNKRLK